MNNASTRRKISKSKEYFDFTAKLFNGEKKTKAVHLGKMALHS
jgi:hypothetical protein